MDGSNFSPFCKKFSMKASTCPTKTTLGPEIAPHFPQIDQKKPELTPCTSLEVLDHNNSTDNSITPERQSVAQPRFKHVTGEKYDFHSVPLFSKDLFRSMFASHIISTGSEENNEKHTKAFGDSIVWIPHKREEWDRCSSELAALCANAGLRRARALKRNFSTSLPEIYIKDRIDIDDPLRGFQIRHKSGGWLQGFILTTTFTTWTHYFRWDSRHPKSGMIPAPLPKQKIKWDDGSLSTELESQPRSGDPVGGGVVWSTIGEISLLSGLGCGEYLLRMGMEDIFRQGCYQYVVLQATDFSKPFYEKFGFKRVGCVTRYGKHPHLVGYRHWTYADEKNLVVHGGPSYMMGVRVKDFMMQFNSGESILDFATKFIVDKKPNILPLPIVPNPRTITHSRNPMSRKRKSHSSSANGLVRVVSYCNEGEKENIINSCAKRQKKKNLLVKQNSINAIKNTWMLPKAESITITKQSQKKRTRERGCVRDDNSEPKLRINQTLQLDPIFLRKQKFTISQRVRNKPIFYNKVVARKNIQRTLDSFFFVINFDAESGTLRLVKLEPRGTFFKGKREGRVKWKAVLDGKKGLSGGDAKYDWTVPSSEWDIVQSVMVTKTTIVADESWDIIEPTKVVQ